MDETVKAKRLRQGGLVLERELQTSVTIYDKTDASVEPIVITLTKIRGQRASLHINAPQHIGIVRTEIMRKDEVE